MIYIFLRNVEVWILIKFRRKKIKNMRKYLDLIKCVLFKKKMGVRW